MWVNPKHPQREQLLARQHQAEQPAPPEPTGEVLAAFPRRGKYGAEEELRVSLDEFEGHPFVGVRLWSRDGRTGAWWPTKKGVSIRVAELEGVAAALTEAMERAQETRPLGRQGVAR